METHGWYNTKYALILFIKFIERQYKIGAQFFDMQGSVNEYNMVHVVYLQWFQQ